MTIVVTYASIEDDWFANQDNKWLCYLNTVEQQRYHKMRSNIKAQQLLLSRCLMHQALKYLGYSSSNDYQIINFNQLFIPAANQVLSLSITHSGNIAAICISEEIQLLGIDIEQCKKRDFPNLADVFCCETELKALAESCDYKTNFYQLWTAKEALAKASQKPLIDLYRCNCTNVLHSHQGELGWNNAIYYYKHLRLEKTLGIVVTNHPSPDIQTIRVESFEKNAL